MANDNLKENFQKNDQRECAGFVGSMMELIDRKRTFNKQVTEETKDLLDAADEKGYCKKTIKNVAMKKLIPQKELEFIENREAMYMHAAEQLDDMNYLQETAKIHKQVEKNNKANADKKVEDDEKAAARGKFC